jgi:hypothetical protein
MHKHHIIPEYMGGTNDPSNIKLVTIEEHAAIHQQLWELLGHWQDYVAWKALSGQITNDQAIRLAVSMANKGKKVVFSEEHKRNLSISRQRQKPPMLGKKFTEEHKNKLLSAIHKKKACSGCGREFNLGNYTRHIKACNVYNDHMR